MTILPNFPIILNGLRLPGLGTFTFPPATRFNKSKEKQIERLKLQKEPVGKSIVSILLWSSFNVLEPWTLVFIWKFRNNCFSKAAFNRPNQSVIIGIIYKWLANNCLIMKWPDFTTTGFYSFQSKPLFTAKHLKVFYFTFSRSFIDTYFPIEVWVSPRFILSL